MDNKVVNEHDERISGGSAENITPQHDSGARVQMFGSHRSQALPLLGAQPRRIMTGAERKFGEVTFDMRISVDAEVHGVVRKFVPTLGQGGISENPLTAVIFYDTEKRRYDIKEICTYHSMHQRFGFKMVPTKAMSTLSSAKTIAKDTVLSHSPSLDSLGNYRYGINAYVALMDVPGVTEDGLMISDRFAEKCATECIESRSRSWGKKWYPLNIYGNDEVYKAHPDVGETVRKDGIVFALRRIPEGDDIICAPLDMNPKALRRVDHLFDRCEYGKGGAKVIDVMVHSDGKQPSGTPPKMEEQAKKYHHEITRYYQSIREHYNRLYREVQSHDRFSPAFSAMMRKVNLYLPCDIRHKSTQMYQHSPLDNWHVKVTYHYVFVPNRGSKFTGCHGDKGVMCYKVPWQDMPVDAWGNRADIIAASGSTINRMNIGRPIEHEVNGSMEMLTDAIRLGMGRQDLMVKDPETEMAMDIIRSGWTELPAGEQAMLRIAKYIDGSVDRAFEVLREFYEIVSPKMNELFDRKTYRGTPAYHVNAVLEDGIYLWVPQSNPVKWLDYVYDESEFDTEAYAEAMERFIASGGDGAEPKPEMYGAKSKVIASGIVGELSRRFPPRVSKVMYRGESGKVGKTKEDIMIAQTYMMMLEKTATDWSGAASTRHQHYGLPAKMSKQDKHSLPASGSAVRILGEAEVRLGTAVAPPKLVAQMLEMSNSPEAHKNVVGNIYSSENPTNIEEVLDRDIVPEGTNRAQVFVHHTMQMAGIEFIYVDHSGQQEIYPKDPGGVMTDLGLVDPDDDDDVNEDAVSDDDAEVEED